LVVQLPTNGFNYTSAIDSNNVKINGTNPTFSIPISVSSPRIIIGIVKSIMNLNYIPNINSNSSFSSDQINCIQLMTVGKNNQEVLGFYSVNPSVFVANTAYRALSFQSSRNSTLSGSYTNISVNYLTVLGTS
jgi:hypothetical protein